MNHSRSPALRQLQKRLGPSVVHLDEAALGRYAGDKWMASHLPEAVALPRDTDSVSEVVRFASRHQIPLTARGAGFGYVGGCVPARGGIVLSLERMSRIKEVHRTDFVGVVQPGVVTAQFQAAVEAQGLYYPPDPASFVVGAFVLIGLFLIGGLVLLFSKGWNLTPTITVRLRTVNVGLLIPTAQVRMAGVPVGYVERLELARDGKSVLIFLKIFKQYEIRRDARFLIEQIGFLGDQFISIVPQANAAPPIQDGDEVDCEEPFNFQEVARSAVGLITRVNETVLRLNKTVTRVDEHLFSDETLTNVTTTVENFRRVSERAFSAVETFDAVIQTNIPTIGTAMSNFVVFTQDLTKMADDLNGIVATNRNGINGTIERLSSTSTRVDALVADAQAGKGLVGFLLRDEGVKAQTSLVMSNLTILSSNLNKYGFPYKPKRESRTLNPSTYTGRRPF